MAKFYRPDELLNAIEISRLHEYYSHPSVNKMKRMASEWFKKPEVTPREIEIWHAKEGKVCCGCVEGKLKDSSNALFIMLPTQVLF